MKKTLIALVLVLMLASCTVQTDPGQTAPDTASPTSESATSAPENAPIVSDKVDAAITSSAEFKSGEQLKSIRVYFDPSEVKKSCDEFFPEADDEKAVQSFMREHDLVNGDSYDYKGYFALRNSFVEEQIKTKFGAVIASCGISADDSRLKYAATAPYIAFTEMSRDELVALDAQNKVTRIVQCDENEGPFDKLTIEALAKLLGADELDGLIPTMIREALPDDTFFVEVGLELASDGDKGDNFEQFLQRNDLSLADGLERDGNSLKGELRLEDIVKLLSDSATVVIAIEKWPIIG